MAPAEKNRTHSRYEPYDAASSHHKAKFAGSSAATGPTAYDVDTTVSAVVVESTEVDNGVESKTMLITQEVVVVDSDTESADSDVVEIGNPAQATVHREIIDVDLIGKEEGIEGLQNSEEEYSEEDDDEEGGEDDDEEGNVDENGSDVGGDWDGDDSEIWGPKMSLEEELDLVEQSTAGYDPEADPEYQEMKRELEDEGWFDAPVEDFDGDFYTHEW